MNRFETEYKWATFEINFGSHMVLDGLTYAEVCSWLKLNKHRLFNHYIYRKNFAQSWSAEFFLRYETEI